MNGTVFGLVTAIFLQDPTQFYLSFKSITVIKPTSPSLFPNLQ